LVSYLSNTKNAAVLSQYSYTYDLTGQQVSKTDHGGQQTAYTYNGAVDKAPVHLLRAEKWQ